MYERRGRGSKKAKNVLTLYMNGPVGWADTEGQSFEHLISESSRRVTQNFAPLA